uniref:NADH-ubiquinone oxidoreductase chain 4 n=1 Tax=Lovenula raynerae TaxID=2487506 RepID=A0A3G4YLK0_9MAXI|nr:NADH dehydrogenase subunit 4 [Lovenula raynerae]
MKFMMKLIFVLLSMPIATLFYTLFMMFLLVTYAMILPLPILASSPDSDFMSFSLIVLSFWLLAAMNQAFFLPKNSNLMLIFLKLLALFLVLSFLSPSTLLFYLFFEASLIPIFCIISGWGYQPERLTASAWMLFYTLISSLPLLMSLILMNQLTFSFSFMFFLSQPVMMSSWMNMTLMAAFLVKFPMYLVHTWLPKAHVEAPVSGSMILAGILLKLGGYGMYRMASLFFISQVNLIVMVTSAIGGSLLSILCCRMSDMKVLIAYSSVVHMAFVILSLASLEKIGLPGVIWMMLAHGLVSSGLFAGANIMYEQTHSRSIVINKGILSSTPELSMMWFFLLMANFGGPFTVNLYSEIFLIMTVISSSLLFIIPIALISFFSAAYSLNLYASSQQGKLVSSNYIIHKMNLRESLVLWSHSWPVLALLMSLSI